MCGKKELEMLLENQEQEVKMKKCSKCGREFPATKEYFNSDKYNKDGLTNQCKECRNKKKMFNLPKPKDGYKFCIKCNRELEIDIKYFPPDKMRKDGLRNVCRECGKDGHFMDDGYVPKHWWSEEKEELFIKVYPHFTNEELISMYFPEETSKSLIDKAFKLGKINKTLETSRRADKQQGLKLSGDKNYNYGKHLSEETKRKMSISKKGKYIGENNKLYGIPKTDKHKRNLSIAKSKLARWKGDKNPRHINPLNGELNGRWAGGIKELYYDLRDHLQDWKKSSMEECNYKCVLTHGEFDNIHHLHNFKDIVHEIFNELELPMLKTIGEYSEGNRNIIYDLLYKKHKYYGNGVCLCKPLHKLFHDTYNYMNNTKEQFEEFSNRYRNFEFDDLLEDKYKYCNVKLKEVS